MQDVKRREGGKYGKKKWGGGLEEMKKRESKVVERGEVS